jgi:hypothetical protein
LIVGNDLNRLAAIGHVVIGHRITVRRDEEARSDRRGATTRGSPAVLFVGRGRNRWLTSTSRDGALRTHGDDCGFTLSTAFAKLAFSSPVCSSPCRGAVPPSDATKSFADAAGTSIVAAAASPIGHAAKIASANPILIAASLFAMTFSMNIRKSGRTSPCPRNVLVSPELNVSIRRDSFVPHGRSRSLWRRRSRTILLK